MNQHIKMDDRASESFVFEGCMNESLYIQENGNFNCRQCEIMVDVDQKAIVSNIRAKINKIIDGFNVLPPNKLDIHYILDY